MRDKIESTVLKNVETRCTHSEGALRELQSLRKNRAPREREKEKDPEDRERKHKLKKVIKKHDEDGKHPPTTGAHGVTRQDGVDVHKGMSRSTTRMELVAYTCSRQFLRHVIAHIASSTLSDRRGSSRRTLAQRL